MFDTNYPIFVHLSSGKTQIDLYVPSAGNKARRCFEGQIAHSVLCVKKFTSSHRRTVNCLKMLIILNYSALYNVPGFLSFIFFLCNCVQSNTVVYLPPSSGRTWEVTKYNLEVLVLY